MWITPVLLTLVSFVIFATAKSAIQEIEGLIVALMATVQFSTCHIISVMRERSVAKTETSV